MVSVGRMLVPVREVWYASACMKRKRPARFKGRHFEAQIIILCAFVGSCGTSSACASLRNHDGVECER